MTVRDKILAGEYCVNLPTKDALVTPGDWQFAQIARIEVYPENYDQYAKDEPGKPKIVRLKPTIEFHLDTITPDKGVVRQKLDLHDRKVAEELLADEVARIETQLYIDLCVEYRKYSTYAIPNKNTRKLFDLAMTKRIKGLIVVVDEWNRLFDLTQ